MRPGSVPGAAAELKASMTGVSFILRLRRFKGRVALLNARIPVGEGNVSRSYRRSCRLYFFAAVKFSVG